MTEIERIIAKGIIPESFLNPEVRNDFVVDEKRKKVWMVCLDMLMEIDRVCKKHDITYFLGYGSLLGAIRHKGFIPWDDDLDIVMKRKDYEKFITLSEEFKHPYFLQIPDSDPGYYHTHAKIRNSNTSAFSPMTGYEGFNQGMWLDIFQLDNFVYEDGLERYEKIKALNIDEGTQMRLHNPNLDEKNKERVKEYLSRNVDPMQTYRSVESIASKYKDCETEYISSIIVSLYAYEKNIFFSEDFSDTITTTFEGFSFPIPKGYDRILRTIYNNYWEFPPLDKRGNWHDQKFNPEMSFLDLYKDIKFNLRNSLK